MVFALPTFFAGVAWRSEMMPVARVTACISCGVGGVGIAAIMWSFSDIYFPVAATMFAIANVTLGVLACRHVSRHRRRIFAALGVSYTIGVLLGPLGCLLLTIPSVWVANRRDTTDEG